MIFRRVLTLAAFLIASLPTVAAAAGFCCFLSASAADATVLRSYLAGLGTSNDGVTPNSVLDIAAGQASDTTAAVYINLASAMAKSTAGAWTAGTGQNGMGNGLTIAASTWYDVCLAYNGNSPDVWFDTSNRATSYSECANRPSGIAGALYRRIGSFLTDGSANIIKFVQNGDEFLWNTPINEASANGFVLINSLHSFALANTPSGVSVDAFLLVDFQRSAFSNAFCTSPQISSSLVPANHYGTNLVFGSNAAVSSLPSTIRTSTAAVNCISDQTTGTTLFLVNFGWLDRRGRDN